jgi:uncharacterized membrane protein HdeD (DUF308 family)
MTDHPLLGAALFVVGAVLVADGYYSSNVQSFFLGHIAALNGVLLVALGCNKLQRLTANANRTLHIPAYNKRPAR